MNAAQIEIRTDRSINTKDKINQILYSHIGQNSQ